MFDSNRFLTVFAIVSFLALALSSLAMAQNKDSKRFAYKAEYVVTESGQSQLVTVWFDQKYIAFSKEGSSQMALWSNWNSDNPGFFQVFPDVKYRIEFDRLTSQDMQPVLEELKLLIKNNQPQDKVVLQQRQFELSVLNTSPAVSKTISSWQNFKTYDYADIGDNEADPVLGKLIHQGFVRGF
jgi:hypothetical protein